MAVRRTAKLNITGDTIIAGSKAAAKKAVPAHVTKQATAIKKMAPAAKKAVAKKAEPKGPVAFESRDWTFLQDKEPTDLHIVFAQQITMRSDVEITPKQVQAVMAMHPSFQRSKTNKARPTYAALDEEIVKQRSVHMVQAHKDAAEAIAARTVPVKKAAAKRPAKKASAAATKRAASSADGIKALADLDKAAPAKKAAAPRKRAAKK